MNTFYLTKVEDNQLHHLRLSVSHTGVDIVAGIMYHSIEKFWQDCETVENAEEFIRQFVKAKSKEGFRLTPYVESVENNLEVYDKAQYHSSGNFPPDLDPIQGSVHTGMFIGWLIENELMSEEFLQDCKDGVERFTKGEITGAQLFRDYLDGTFLLNDLSVTGNRFALYYYELDKGQYISDYEQVLAAGLPSVYHVEDNRENYNKLKAILDKRYAGWRFGNVLDFEN